MKPILQIDRTDNGQGEPQLTLTAHGGPLNIGIVVLVAGDERDAMRRLLEAAALCLSEGIAQ